MKRSSFFIAKKYLILAPVFILIGVMSYYLLGVPLYVISTFPNEFTMLSIDVDDGCFSLCNGLVVAKCDEDIPVSLGAEKSPTYTLRLFNLIPIKKFSLNLLEDDEVLLGGVPLGFSMTIDGVVVVEKSPLQEANILSGDIIKSVDGRLVHSRRDLVDILSDCSNEPVNIEIVRNNKVIRESLTPIYDDVTCSYKMGVWVKDYVSGIGTLTYVKRDGEFGAVGHPITDNECGSNIDISDGEVYACSVLGVSKGAKGSPGEIRAVYTEGKNAIGLISKNSRYGVYGNIDTGVDTFKYLSPINLGGRKSVHPGTAYISFGTKEDGIKKYKIEIIKSNYQNYRDDKSIVFRVVDQELLSQTGGIVQGMSGSPIIQDDRIIGAVTHVFVNDPTKGFGVYIDWMLSE